MLPSGLSFKICNAAQVDLMLGNEDALLGAVMNLLNNAIEAIAGNGEIILTVQQIDQASLQIKIQDNGPGIDDKTRQRLFEPFYTTKVKGTGLGLAVVDSVARAHSGSVYCESNKDGGASFILQLPCINQYITTFSTDGCQQMENSYETV